MLATPRRDRPAEELRASIRTIHEEATRLKELLDALLMLARADTATLVSRSAPVDLAATAYEAAKRAVENARRLGLDRTEITVDAVRSLTVEGDAHLLMRALENLLDNALRHGGGHTALHVASTGASAAITVCDEGRGIPLALRETLFNRFVRGDPSRSTEGFGLGLAIAREIASAHGGTLELLPSERGATFEMRLPLRAAPSPSSGTA